VSTTQPRDQLELAGTLRGVDIQVGRHRHAGQASTLDQRRQQQLEADQLDRFVTEQVAMLPQIARASVDRATFFGASAELGQGRQRGQGAQDAVVLVAHAAAPAAVGQLVIGQPAQGRRKARRTSIGRGRQPG
jgi:hypothetical protein